MEYKHQSEGGFGVAYPVQFSPKPEKKKEKKEDEKSSDWPSRGSSRCAALLILIYRMVTFEPSQLGRDTSESDLFLIGFCPYEDTLSRLDGVDRHTKKLEKNSVLRK